MKLKPMTGKFDECLRAHRIFLYDRVMFLDAKTKYVHIYDDTSIIPCDTIDTSAPVIFERTTNPQIDPRTYVCIKVNDEQRNPLVIHRGE